MNELDSSPVTTPALTEAQRNAYAALSAVLRICDCAGLALVPGPTSVTVWVPQPGRPGRYSALRTVELPQIKTTPMGRNAPRRGLRAVTP